MEKGEKNTTLVEPESGKSGENLPVVKKQIAVVQDGTGKIHKINYVSKKV